MGVSRKEMLYGGGIEEGRHTRGGKLKRKGFMHSWFAERGPGGINGLVDSGLK